MTKKFTLIQLFSILDGRLSTSMDDIYDILNHICNTDLMTHHLPVAFKYLKEKNPKWFIELKEELIKLGCNKEEVFEICMEKLKKDKRTFDIPQMTNDELKDFPEYMIKNSLLIRN